MRRRGDGGGKTPHTGRMGLSLLELIAALAILALLSGIAAPLYTQYVDRGHRAAAQADLLRCAQGMERHASWTFSYLAAVDTDADGLGDTDVGPVTPNLCTPSSTRHVVRLAEAGPSHFVLHATPAPPHPTTDGALGIDAGGTRWWDRNGDGDFGDPGEDRWGE